MKFRFNSILIFILIFILGVFCVPCCKKSTGEPVEENGRPILDLINDKVARETEFADPSANYSDDIRDGFIEKIESDLALLNATFQKGPPMGNIAQVLRKVRSAEGPPPITAPGQIISYFERLKNDPQVRNFRFEFAGAIVLPVNIELSPFTDEETNFISLNTYLFTFDRISDSGSTDPGGSGDGESGHRKICTYY